MKVWLRNSIQVGCTGAHPGGGFGGSKPPLWDFSLWRHLAVKFFVLRDLRVWIGFYSLMQWVFFVDLRGYTVPHNEDFPPSAAKHNTQRRDFRFTRSLQRSKSQTRRDHRGHQLGQAVPFVIRKYAKQLTVNLPLCCSEGRGFDTVVLRCGHWPAIAHMTLRLKMILETWLTRRTLL